MADVSRKPKVMYSRDFLGQMPKALRSAWAGVRFYGADAEEKAWQVKELLSSWVSEDTEIVVIQALTKKDLQDELKRLGEVLAQESKETAYYRRLSLLTTKMSFADLTPPEETITEKRLRIQRLKKGRGPARPGRPWA